MNQKERLLDIYSDGGEGEDFEPVIDEMEAEIATLRAQLAEAREALKYIADYGNYATEGEIETSDGVMHVSDYAGKKL